MADDNRGRDDRFRGGSDRQWRGGSDRGRSFGDRGRGRGGDRFERGEREDRFGGDRQRSWGGREDRSFGDRGQRRDDRGGRFERDGDRRSRGDFRSDRGGDFRSDRRGSFEDRRGGFQGRGGDRQRSWGDRDCDGRFGRGERNERFDRSERGDRGGRFDRSERSFGDRDRDRGQRRDDRGGRFDRDGGRPSFGDSRGRGRGGEDSREWSRDRDRGPRREDRGGRFDRDGGRRGGRDDRRGGAQDSAQNWKSTDEYVSPTGDEPTIPAGVSADELDGQALKALTTLSGPNRDIVARHLVMAGQLIDLDPELAHQHALAASRRAGRVDVVREAAALTAYASGRYEEALRELRAVRRMRGDLSLRAVEADCERGLGRPEKAIELIDATSTVGMDLDEQVELVLVSSGARADLGQYEVGLVLVDDALAALPADTDAELVRRLMSVKADRLRELGRDAEADEVEAEMPAELDDPEIVDISLFADADVDRKGSDLRGSEMALSKEFDSVLLDLDGTAYEGSRPIAHAAEQVVAAREAGMATAFVTNNAMRTPQVVADQLNELGFEATPDMVMTSSMDVVALLGEHLEAGAKVLVIGGEGLRTPVSEAGYVIVDSADDEPAAVVQGLDKQIDWAKLSEAAFAIQRGAKFFATNLDATLPQERGFALGNGALVRAVQHATRVRPLAAGKPEPGIYTRGAALVGGERPIAVGDRLETDVMGAVAAGIPAMHVLTGVHGAREVILAPRGQRPTYLALDMRGLNEAHPRPKHHRDGTWTCGFSQVARVSRNGVLMLDDVELTEPVTVTLDSYRALAAAAWEWSTQTQTVTCPEITVVENDDPAGIVVAPEPVEEAAEESAEAPQAPVTALVDDSEDADLAALDTEDGTVTFLPGEEELEALLMGATDEDGAVGDFEEAADAVAVDEAEDIDEDGESGEAVAAEDVEADPAEDDALAIDEDEDVEDEDGEDAEDEPELDLFSLTDEDSL